MRVSVLENSIIFEDFPVDFYSKESLFKILSVLSDDFYVVFNSQSASSFKLVAKEEITSDEAKDVVNEFFNTLISFEQAKVTFLEIPQ